MSRIKSSRQATGNMGSGFGDFLRNVFTKENIQTGLQIVQNATGGNTSSTAVQYGNQMQTVGPDSTINDYMKYILLGGAGLAAIYFLKKK